MDVYADEGITGTSVEKRDDFQRLLKDCRRGRIDKVLTKSTARFARNTSESLIAVRELRDLGIGVCFEEQGIDTAQMSGELLTAIFSMIAQKESEAISENIRWSIRNRMENGTFTATSLPFGYTRDETGEIKVDLQRAGYVKEIFEAFLSGRNTKEIAEEMKRRQEIETPLQSYQWTVHAIARILKNEKYTGNSLWQKSFMTQTLPRRYKVNKGELAQYYVNRPRKRQDPGHLPGRYRGGAGDRTTGLEERIMSAYITGDTHGGFQRFGMKYFPEQKKMNREDTVIIAGDFGGLWGGTPAEEYWLDWLEDKPFTTAFLDGNHENFAMLNALPERLWHGGRIHEVRPHVLHLMRGQVFDIEGYTFFTMGGASSHDIQDGILDPEEPGFEERYWRMRRARAMFRVNGISWWPEELPSDEEYEEARKNLDAHDWAVDYILTHCAPTSITQKIIPHARADRLTDFLEEVKNRARYHYWLFGHLHDNQAVDKKHILLWEQVVQVI